MYKESRLGLASISKFFFVFPRVRVIFVSFDHLRYGMIITFFHGLTKAYARLKPGDDSSSLEPLMPLPSSLLPRINGLTKASVPTIQLMTEHKAPVKLNTIKK